MNPDSQDPLQPQDNQQTYQNPETPAPPQIFSPGQAPTQTQPQGTFVPAKQSNKVPAVLIGGAVVILGIAAGAFLLLGGGEPQPSNQENLAEDNQSTVVPLEESVPEETVDTSDDSAQKDNQHKNNVVRLIAAANEYAANNNGRLPTEADIDSTFLDQYMGGNFSSPDTSSPYALVETDPKTGEMQYMSSSTCGSDNTIILGSTRQVAVRVLLSTNAYYCATN